MLACCCCALGRSSPNSRVKDPVGQPARFPLGLGHADRACAPVLSGLAGFLAADPGCRDRVEVTMRDYHDALRTPGTAQAVRDAVRAAKIRVEHLLSPLMARQLGRERERGGSASKTSTER